jgi:hypothetical protein
VTFIGIGKDVERNALDIFNQVRRLKGQTKRSLNHVSPFLRLTLQDVYLTATNFSFLAAVIMTKPFQYSCMSD